MSERILWAALVTVVMSLVSLQARRRIRPLRFPRTPYEVYMNGQLLAGPISLAVLIVMIATAV